jgi:MFS family permease
MPLRLAYALGQLRGQINRSRLLHPQTDEDHNELMLYLNTAAVGVPFGGIMSFLPVFMARLGASETLIGWLTSAPALMAIFAMVPAAVLAERFTDQVKVRVVATRILRFGYLACALAPFVFRPEILPVVLVVIWTLNAFPSAVAMPAWTTVISQAVTPRRRAQLNGTRWALLSIVSAIFSAFFGWLLDAVVFPYNYQLVFLISFLAGNLDPYFFAKLRVPPIQPAPRSAARSPVQRMVDYFSPVIKNRGFLAVLGIMIFYRISLNLPAPLFSPFWVNNLKASDTLLGLRGTVGNLALMVGYIFWGRSANRLGDRRVLLFAAWGTALHPILTSLLPDATWLLPVAALWGLTVSGLDVGLFNIMLAAIPAQRQPLFSGVWNMVANAAIFVGPLIGAAISAGTSTGTALLIAGVAQIVTTAPFLLLKSTSHETGPTSA